MTYLKKANTDYFIQLDGLRCVAILLVLLTHWCPEYTWIHKFKVGFFGLDLFFVLSGFLITRILLKSKTIIDKKELSIKKGLYIFYIRRILRIFPAYYFIVLITWLFNSGIVEDALWWNLTYTTNFYLMKLGDWAGTITHFWSLAVEEQFYLLWPLIIFFIAKKHLQKVFIAIIFVAVLMRFYFLSQETNHVAMHVFTPLCFDAFGIGAVLAYLSINRATMLKGILDKKYFFLLIFLFTGFSNISLLFMESYNFFYMVLPRFLNSVFCFWLVGKAFFGFKGIIGQALENSKIVYLGKISYGIYLIHNFIPGFFLGISFPEIPMLRFVIYLIATVLAAELVKRLIERPFNNLKTQFSL